MANKPFQAAIQLLKTTERAAAMFGLNQDIVEERLLDLAIMAAQDKARSWEWEERNADWCPQTGKSVLLRAWGWYIPRNREQYQTPIFWRFRQGAQEPEGDIYPVYHSNGKLVEVGKERF